MQIEVTNIEVAKRLAEWGTYGYDGKQPLTYVRLIDCSTDHLKAILRQVGGLSDYGVIINSILKDRQ